MFQSQTLQSDDVK